MKDQEYKDLKDRLSNSLTKKDILNLVEDIPEYEGSNWTKQEGINLLACWYSEDIAYAKEIDKYIASK